MFKFLLILFFSLSIFTQSFAKEKFTVFPYEAPELLDLTTIKNKRMGVSFQNIKEVKRSAGTNIYSKVLPSVVKVVTNSGHGTGVIISNKGNGLIISNYHVVEGYKTVGIIFGIDDDKKETHIATVLKFNAISDLALLSLNSKKNGLVPIQNSVNEINIGANVHAVGHPLGEDWTYTRGYVSQKRKDYTWKTGKGKHHKADVIQTQTPINPGNSGGPLVNDEGQLVGINSFGNMKAQGLNFAISNNTIRLFLKSKGDIKQNIIKSKYKKNLISTFDKNKNGIIDGYLWDQNKNNKVDTIGLDKDEDTFIETILIDKNENKIFEVVIKHKVVKGKKIVFYEIDKNEDKKIDAIGVDVNLDGKIDKVVPAKWLWINSNKW